MCKKLMSITIVVALMVIGCNWAREATTEYHEAIRYHYVSSGETMWNIGERYFDEQDRYDHIGEWVHRIRQANDGKAIIHAGERLVIPLELIKRK